MSVCFPGTGRNATEGFHVTEVLQSFYHIPSKVPYSIYLLEDFSDRAFYQYFKLLIMLKT